MTTGTYRGICTVSDLENSCEIALSRLPSPVAFTIFSRTTMSTSDWISDWPLSKLGQSQHYPTSSLRPHPFPRVLDTSFRNGSQSPTILCCANAQLCFSTSSFHERYNLRHSGAVFCQSAVFVGCAAMGSFDPGRDRIEHQSVLPLFNLRRLLRSPSNWYLSAI